MTAPLVAAIVLNFNGQRFIEDCLSSLIKQTYENTEIIFIDNGSHDGSVEYVRERFPTVKVIEVPENVGFVANNFGIEQSDAKYIVLVNNDTRSDEDLLRVLVEVAESDEQIGMCAPKILSIYNPQMFDSVGGLLIYPDGLARGRGRQEQDTGQYDQVEEILLPSGCCALYRKAMLDEIGLLDGDFFAYCEDTDLGLRGRLAGWKAVSTPAAVIYHYYSGSGGKYSPLKAFLVERNHMWVVVKNFPLTMMWKVPFYTFWRYLFQTFSVFTGKGSAGKFEGSRLELAGTLLKAYGAALRGLPKMLGKRKAVQAARRITDREFADLLRRYRISVAELVFKE